MGEEGGGNQGEEVGQAEGGGDGEGGGKAGTHVLYTFEAPPL